jgi:hypothetical protein
MQNQSDAMRQSIDKKITTMQQDKNRIKGGSSSKTVYTNPNQSANVPNQTNQRIQSGVPQKNFQNNNRRIQSPNSPNQFPGSQTQPIVGQPG